MGTRSPSSRLSAEDKLIRLVRDAIDVTGLRDAIARESDGAVVIFQGTVRNWSRNRRVRFLEYHAYESMALLRLEEIVSRVCREYAVRDAGILHRLGRLLPGECSVAIVVVGAHRAPAFDACRSIIDTLKKTVPIWKKEIYEDGENWVEGDSEDGDKASAKARD